MKCSLVQSIMTSLWKCCTTNLHMRQFFLTPSLIGSINARTFILKSAGSSHGVNLQVLDLRIKSTPLQYASSVATLSGKSVVLVIYMLPVQIRVGNFLFVCSVLCTICSGESKFTSKRSSTSFSYNTHNLHCLLVFHIIQWNKTQTMILRNEEWKLH